MVQMNRFAARNWDTDVEDKCMDTKRGKWQGGGDGGVMNWAIGIDMYTLTHVIFKPTR